MYKTYYGLKENPFNVNPDPRYLFMTPEIDEALSGFNIRHPNTEGDHQPDRRGRDRKDYSGQPASGLAPTAPGENGLSLQFPHELGSAV